MGNHMLSTTTSEDPCEKMTISDDTQALLSKPNGTTAALTENTLPLPEWLTGHMCILLGGIVVFAPHLVMAAMSDAQTLLERTLPDLGWTLFLHLAFLLSMISEEREATDAAFYGLYSGFYSIACACIGIPMHRPGIAGGGALAISLTAGVMLLLGPQIRSGLQRPPWVPCRHRRTFSLCMMAIGSAASIFMARLGYWIPFTHLEVCMVFALHLSHMAGFSTLLWDHQVTRRRERHRYAHHLSNQFSAQIMVQVWLNNELSPFMVAGAFALSTLIAGGYMLWDWKAGTLPLESEGVAEKQGRHQSV